MKNKFKDYEHLFYNYKWSIYEEEKPTWDYLQTFLRPGCTFFDIGCQKGIYSKGVIDLYGDDCFVYGFDVLEHPEILELQKKYNNFKFVNSAVGDGKSIENCTIHYDNSVKLENQKTISLDKFCEENNIKKIDIIKVDVDGLQDKVIFGFKKILKTLKPIIVVEMNNNIGYEDQSAEIMELRIDKSNDLIDKKTWDTLISLGYQCQIVKNGSNCFFVKTKG
jgi:FkbM family methyltransferase